MQKSDFQDNTVPPQHPVYTQTPYYPPGQSMPPAQIMNQPMFYQQMNQPQVVVVSTNVNPFSTPATDPFPERQIPEHVPMPQKVTCIHCKARVPTLVNKELSGTGWCICIMLTIFCLPCFWFTFLMDVSFKNVHTCPSCNRVVSYPQ